MWFVELTIADWLNADIQQPQFGTISFKKQKNKDIEGN